MIDKEKAIRGLECCIVDPEGKTLCGDCPYYEPNTYCLNRLKFDALIALKEQRPHVLTVDEAKLVHRPIWLEERWPDDVLGSWVGEFKEERNGEYVIFGNRCLYMAYYMDTWRMWNDRPTKAQSKMVPWEGVKSDGVQTDSE